MLPVNLNELQQGQCWQVPPRGMPPAHPTTHTSTHYQNEEVREHRSKGSRLPPAESIPAAAGSYDQDPHPFSTAVCFCDQYPFHSSEGHGEGSHAALRWVLLSNGMNIP